MTNPNTDQWITSKKLLERSRLSLAGGVSSPFRAKAPVPLFFTDALGSKLTDVDGNRYIDYTLAWGPLILGHRHPKLVEAIRRQADRPHNYGAQHELEYQVAEAIQTLIPCAERVAFTSTGSEAVQIALRLARAFTKRNLVIKFEGHYHGWMDSVLLSYKPTVEQLETTSPLTGIVGSAGQVLNATENVIVLPWNNLDLIESTFRERGSEIAAVITEPILCNSGCIEPHENFLAGLASVTKHHGALLIFDEVITGFRRSVGGAQSYYQVIPDLATFGKAIAGGLPLSAIAGRRDIMSMIFEGGVVFGGTFNGSPLCLAAALTTITELANNDGVALKETNKTGDRLIAGLMASSRRHGIPLLITGFGAASTLHFTSRSDLNNYRDTLEDDRTLLQLCLLEALREGVYIVPDGRMYLSTAHSEQDVEVTMGAMDRVFARLAG